VGPRAGLDAVAKRNNSWPFRELSLGRPSLNLVTILTELCRFRKEKCIQNFVGKPEGKRPVG
jgi:hypothetical protein